MMRGIDGQVMINKTVDYSRQMSNQMQEHENGKEFASRLQQSKVELQNQSVNEAKEAQDRRVSREKNEEDDGRGGRRKKRRGTASSRGEAEAAVEMTAEEEVMSRVPKMLSRSERSLGGSIDINI